VASQQFFMYRYTPFAAYVFKDVCASQIRFKLEYPHQGKEVGSCNFRVHVSLCLWCLAQGSSVANFVALLCRPAVLPHRVGAA
jgi:hypothetical protein